MPSQIQFKELIQLFDICRITINGNCLPVKQRFDQLGSIRIGTIPFVNIPNPRIGIPGKNLFNSYPILLVSSTPRQQIRTCRKTGIQDGTEVEQNCQS